MRLGSRSGSARSTVFLHRLKLELSLPLTWLSIWTWASRLFPLENASTASCFLSQNEDAVLSQMTHESRSPTDCPWAAGAELAPPPQTTSHSQCTAGREGGEGGGRWRQARPSISTFKLSGWGETKVRHGSQLLPTVIWVYPPPVIPNCLNRVGSHEAQNADRPRDGLIVISPSKPPC